MINEIKNYSVEVRTNPKNSINAAKFIFKILFFSILLTLVLYYCVTRTKLSSKKRFLMQLLESKDLFIPIRTSYTQQGLECPTLFRANYSTFDGPKVRDYPSTSDSEIIGTILMRMRRDRDFVSELLKGANIVVRGIKERFTNGSFQPPKLTIASPPTSARETNLGWIWVGTSKPFLLE